MPVDEQWDNSDVGDAEPEPATKPKPIPRPPKKPTTPPKQAAPRATAPPPAPRATVPPPAAKPVESSLQLLAKDLMPPAPAVEPPPPPDIPVNLGRTVRALPPWSRAWRWLRHKLRLDRLSARQRWIVGGVVTLLLIGIVAAFATRGSEARGMSAADVAQRAHGEVTSGKYRDALASYQALLVALPGTATDPALIADLGRVADHGDAASSSAALDMLAWQVGGPGYEELLARTVSKSSGVRHHAVALADSEGIGDRVDRVAGWVLDIEQTKSCEQKRALVAKIAAAHDKRLAAAQREAGKGCATTTPTTTTTKAGSTTTSTHRRPKPRW